MHWCNMHCVIIVIQCTCVCHYCVFSVGAVLHWGGGQFLPPNFDLAPKCDMKNWVTFYLTFVNRKQ